MQKKHCVKKFRKIAHEVYRKHDFFVLSDDEFLQRCYILQRCGAGIVLGHPKDGYDVRVVTLENACQKIYDNVPLGRFGEICYKWQHDENFVHTGLYGFCDQRGRIWCCGPIDQTATINDKHYFPYCIEPLFERIWWVDRCWFYPDMSSFGTDGRGVVITTCPFLSRILPMLNKLLIRLLQKFADKFPITRDLSIVIKRNTVIKSRKNSRK